MNVRAVAFILCIGWAAVASAAGGPPKARGAPHEALQAGEDPRDVWLAVCEHFEVPVSDRH